MVKAPAPFWSARNFNPHIHIRQPHLKIPVFGEWVRRIGQIGTMLATPCTDDPVLWIEGFFFNLPKLAWSLLSPDLNDSVINRAGRRHGKKRGFTFNVEGFIEGEITDVELPGYAKILFRLGNLAQEIGFFFMLIDATEDFLINWVSTVYQWAGCNTGMGPWIKASNVDGLALPLGTPQRCLVGGAIEGDGTLLQPGGVGVYLPVGHAAGVGYTIKTKPWALAGPPTATVHAALITNDGETIMRTGAIKPNSDHNGTGSNFAFFPGQEFSGQGFQLWFEAEGGYADLTGSFISVVSGPDRGFGPGMGQSIRPIDLPPILGGP